jgi:hypothetical protein
MFGQYVFHHRVDNSSPTARQSVQNQPSQPLRSAQSEQSSVNTMGALACE